MGIFDFFNLMISVKITKSYLIGRKIVNKLQQKGFSVE